MSVDWKPRNLQQNKQKRNLNWQTEQFHGTAIAEKINQQLKTRETNVNE